MYIGSFQQVAPLSYIYLKTNNLILINTYDYHEIIIYIIALADFKCKHL
ncbi:hypothetical protein J2Z81_002563 [Virgibacillus campisalis]|uniref:Uncharacterized protein n=1 Tax=Virgibacillus alimentarius TaxID=698769 RepID=A0ABS4SAQ2_9BACI|nr:hypothetical protein [Virgibacillus alimentarius]